MMLSKVITPFNSASTRVKPLLNGQTIYSPWINEFHLGRLHWVHLQIWRHPQGQYHRKFRCCYSLRIDQLDFPAIVILLDGAFPFLLPSKAITVKVYHSFVLCKQDSSNHLGQDERKIQHESQGAKSWFFPFLKLLPNNGYCFYQSSLIIVKHHVQSDRCHRQMPKRGLDFHGTSTADQIVRLRLRAAFGSIYT